MEENHSLRWKVPFPTNVTFALRCLNLLHLSSPQLVSVSFLSVAHCGISPYVISIIPKKGHEEEVTGKKKTIRKKLKVAWEKHHCCVCAHVHGPTDP